VATTAQLLATSDLLSTTAAVATTTISTTAVSAATIKAEAKLNHMVDQWCNRVRASDHYNYSQLCLDQP
jgi:hypothetical protein